MLQAIDAHIHFEKYTDEQCDAIVQRAANDGIAGIVAVSMDLASSKRTRQLSQRYPHIVIPAYGFHPEQQLPTAGQEAELVSWIIERHKKGEQFAIGEVGLPYYNALEAKQNNLPFPYEPYIAFLDRMLLLAKQLNKPVVLHAVYEDAQTTLELLRKHNIRKAHFHWFKGPEESVVQMIEAGYHISITPDVYVEQEIRTLVQRYPLELMMVETDGPWPFEGPFDGRSTEPAMIVDVITEIAKIKQLTVDAVAEAVYQNTIQFYK